MSEEPISIVGLSTPRLTDTTVKVIQSNQIPGGGPPALITKSGVSDASKIPPSKIQDVRVDNWGNYCLQRFQAMYERSEFCDLTLQFHNLQIIKVHRIVLNMCTEYFSNLERLFGLTNGMLVLPKDVEFNSMLVIIKFFYTGKLEVRGAQFNDIYRTVKLMNVNILTKLLEAHARKPESAVASKPPGQIMLKTSNSQVLKSLVHSGLSASSLQGGMRKKLTVTRPLPHGVKTKTVLARVQQQTIRVGGLPNKTGIKATTITPKRLPIWKERKTILQGTEIKNTIPQKVEPARPTRFEWPEPDDEGSFRLVQSLPDEPTDSLSSSLSQNPAIIFDAVKTQIDGNSLLKHKIPIDETPDHNSKMARLHEENDIEKELAAMEGNDIETDESNFDAHTLEDMSNVLCEEVSEHTEVETSIDITTSEPTLIPNPVEEGNADAGNLGVMNSSPPKKIVKTVRFAPEVEKENKAIEKETSPIVQPGSVPMIECSTTTKEEQPQNHSKIISEVLKKYPELVKDNKSVKLKIVQKGPPEPGAKEGKSKVSYIVLKSSSSDSIGSVVLKKSGSSPTKSKFWETEDTVKKPSVAAENTLGPWTCVPCGTVDAPEHFDSYYLYRKHLVEVHGEKVDARICEYCGYKASKRNLLLYHLYTKHSVTPPSNYVFPRCDRCDYVALSESLLNKHKIAHDTAKEFSCHVCRANFKSSASLQTHMASNLHRNRDLKEHACPYCQKQFARISNLNSHIRTLHKDVPVEMMRIEDSSDHSKDSDFQNAEDKHVEAGKTIGNDGQHAEAIDEIGGSITVPLSILPSSEAEALNNVASSIAASLGLGSQIHHTGEGYTEHILGDGTQQVYVLDSSSEVGGVEISQDGTVLLSNVESVDSDGQFLVQDVHGNKFRKITGQDSDGNPVVFFQLTDESVPDGITALGNESEVIEEQSAPVTNDVVYEFDSKTSLGIQNDHMYLDPQKCSVFVSSESGIQGPVTLSSEEMEQTQTLVTYAGDGTQVIELLPLVDPIDMHSSVQAENEQDQTSDVEHVSENGTANREELIYPVNSGTAHEVQIEEEEISYEGRNEVKLEEEVVEMGGVSSDLVATVVEEEQNLD